MKLGTIVKTSFIISMLLTLIGAYLKITHSEGAETLLIVGVIATLIFIVSAIYEVRTSKRIRIPPFNGIQLLYLLQGIAGTHGIIFQSIMEHTPGMRHAMH